MLKSRSPSCGTGDVKLHEDGAVVSEDATGVFAKGMAESLPGVPRISEVDLDDPARRDHWLTRVFALAELRELGAGSQEISKLHDFHARWKMVLMAHSERTARRLGRSLAATRDARTALPRYQDSFLAGLAEAASVERTGTSSSTWPGISKDALIRRIGVGWDTKSVRSTPARYRWPFRCVPSPVGPPGSAWAASWIRPISPNAPTPSAIGGDLSRVAPRSGKNQETRSGRIPAATRR